MKKLIHILLLTFLFGTFISANFKEQYYIIDKTNYQRNISAIKSIVRRYIIFDKIEKPKKDDYYLADEATKTSNIVFLIDRNKDKDIVEFFQKHDESLQVHHFYKGLFYLSKQLYQQAINEFDQYNEESYLFLKYLLTADCKFEIKSSTDIDNLVSKYQMAYDKATEDYQKELVKYRIKYIRYNR